MGLANGDWGGGIVVFVKTLKGERNGIGVTQRTLLIRQLFQVGNMRSYGGNRFTVSCTYLAATSAV